jgi:hypothetical protein
MAARFRIPSPAQTSFANAHGPSFEPPFCALKGALLRRDFYSAMFVQPAVASVSCGPDPSAKAALSTSQRECPPMFTLSRSNRLRLATFRAFIFPPAWRLAHWRTRGFMEMGKHGGPGLLAAAILVLATVAIDRGLAPGPVDRDALSGAVTILATVVTFFGVATLAVSVSLTLLSSAVDSESDLLDIFVNDRERDLLLQTIFASFLVALANLCLLAAQLLHPLPALALPVILAVLTLLIMVGYIIERVRLFDELGLVSFLTKRIESRLPVMEHLGAGDGDLKIQLKSEIGRDFLRISTILRVLIKEGRVNDADEALRMSLNSLTKLIRLQTAPGFTLPSVDQQRESVDTVDDPFKAELGLLGSGWNPYANELLESTWLIEIVAFSAFKNAVLSAYKVGDGRLMERWLAWINVTWIYLMRALPAAQQQPQLDIERSRLVGQLGAFLHEIEAATRDLPFDAGLGSWGVGSWEKGLGSWYYSRFGEVFRRVLSLCAEVAAAVVDFPPDDKAFPCEAADLGSPHYSDAQLSWIGDALLLSRTCMQLFFEDVDDDENFGFISPLTEMAEKIRPDVLEYFAQRTREIYPEDRVSGRYADGSGYFEWRRAADFAARLAKHLPKAATAVCDPTRHSKTLGSFEVLTAAQRKELRRIAGFRNHELISRLDTSAGNGLLGWQLNFVGGLISRV